MANPYLEVLKAKRMKMSIAHSNPVAHVMGGKAPSSMSKVVNFSDRAQIKSPVKAGQNMTKPANPTKANRVKARYPKQGKKRGFGGNVGKNYGTYK